MATTSIVGAKLQIARAAMDLGLASKINWFRTGKTFLIAEKF